MKTCNDDGFIQLHRSILDWEWFTDGNTFVLFVYLLLSANWQDTRYRGKEIKRGQLIVSVAELSKTLSMTNKQIRTAFEHLKKTGEIKVQNMARYGTLVTVEKYDFYQSEKVEEGKKRANKTANKGQIKGEKTASLPIYENKLNNINNNNNILVCLTDAEYEKLFSHIDEADHLGLSDELVSIPTEGINDYYNYAVGVAKNLGVWREVC